MDVSFRRVVVLTGPYGSGKTELAIGLALAAQQRLACSPKPGPVVLADIDVLKPYFRSREASDQLRAAGVSVIAPAGALANSDLPILPAELRGTLARNDVTAYLDVGGDPVGARALGSISDVVGAADHDVLLVLNRYRPFMDSVEHVLESAHQIEQASHLTFTGIVSNTHMLEQTTVHDVVWGLELAGGVADALGVPVRLLGVPEGLSWESEAHAPGLPPVLRVRRYMKPEFMGGVVLAPPAGPSAAP